jgi:hypothetical protein
MILKLGALQEAIFRDRISIAGNEHTNLNRRFFSDRSILTKRPIQFCPAFFDFKPEIDWRAEIHT